MDEPAPDVINTYADGALQNRIKQSLSAGAAGVWLNHAANLQQPSHPAPANHDSAFAFLDTTARHDGQPRHNLDDLDFQCPGQFGTITQEADSTTMSAGLGGH